MSLNSVTLEYFDINKYIVFLHPFCAFCARILNIAYEFPISRVKSFGSGGEMVFLLSNPSYLVVCIVKLWQSLQKIVWSASIIIQYVKYCAHIMRHIQCNAVTYATSVGTNLSP